MFLKYFVGFLVICWSLFKYSIDIRNYEARESLCSNKMEYIVYHV